MNREKQKLRNILTSVIITRLKNNYPDKSLRQYLISLAQDTIDGGYIEGTEYNELESLLDGYINEFIKKNNNNE